MKGDEINVSFELIFKFYPNLEILTGIREDPRSSFSRTLQLSKGDKTRKEAKMNIIFEFVLKIYPNLEVLEVMRADLRSSISAS